MTKQARHLLVAILLSTGLAGLLPGAQAQIAQTNIVWVTNVVVMTVTNVVTLTNALPGLSTAHSTRSTNAAIPDLDWVPPEDKFDWVQLKSGEWLKGRIKAMQDRELEFDSEELDLQTFDWKDVRQLRSPRTMDVLFAEDVLYSGPVKVTPTKVTVGEDPPHGIARDQLLGLTPGGSKELNYWSGKVSLGLTVRAGNTEQVDYNAQLKLQRRTPATRLSLDYLGNLSSTDGSQTANNQRVNSEFDLWLSRRLYLILPFAEYYKDPFQNLQYRLTGGAGCGYDLIDRPTLEWNITAGPAYQYTAYESVQPGDPTTKGAAALVFGTHFDWDITRRIELILEYRGQYTSQKVGETTHHAVGTLSLELTKRFDLDVSFIWDRITNPQVSADGTQPQPDDYRLVLGLGMDF